MAAGDAPCMEEALHLGTIVGERLLGAISRFERIRVYNAYTSSANISLLQDLLHYVASLLWTTNVYCTQTLSENDINVSPWGYHQCVSECTSEVICHEILLPSV